MFRVSDLGDILYCVNKWVFPDVNSFAAGFTKYSDILKLNAFLIGIPAFLILIVAWKYKKGIKVHTLVHLDPVDYLSRQKTSYWCMYVTIVLLLLLCLSPSRSPEFIYFQF
jgi:hypothetical protein